MELNKLLLNAQLVKIGLPFPYGQQDVQNIQVDSRLVGPFDVFVSVPCPTVQENIEDALNRRCKMIVVQTEMADLPCFQRSDVFAIPCENPRLALAKLAAVFYGAQPDHVVAVTGTNGKSSTVHFVRQFWDACQLPAASLGTLGLSLSHTDLSERSFDVLLKSSSLTTLDSLRLHQVLSKLKAHHINYLAFESSSHGLDQYRLHGVKLKAAAFTNLTQDHMDYHQTVEAYFKAKAKLFSEVLPVGATAVLHKNAAFFDELKTICTGRQHKIITFSVHDQTADLFISNHKRDGSGQRFDLHAQGKIFKDCFVNISGDFQIENILTAIGLVMATDISLEQCIQTLPSLTAANGRLECVGSSPQQAKVYVDYAHTPDALQKALQNLRPFTNGALWVVFGCGGNRDATKRPLMGKIAFELADRVVVTDDNPRFEDADHIREEIINGIDPFKRHTVHVIANRSAAIEFALLHAKDGDVILIAGKGHEQGQIIAGTVFPFDDRQETLSLIQKMS